MLYLLNPSFPAAAMYMIWPCSVHARGMLHQKNYELHYLEQRPPEMKALIAQAEATHDQVHIQLVKKKLGQEIQLNTARMSDRADLLSARSIYVRAFSSSGGRKALVNKDIPMVSALVGLAFEGNSKNTFRIS